MLVASQAALLTPDDVSPDNTGDTRVAGLTPGWARCPGEKHGSPLQYSCLENPTEREAWWATVHRVAQSPTQLRRLSRQARCEILVCSPIRDHIISHPSSTQAGPGLGFSWPWEVCRADNRSCPKARHVLKGSSPVLQKEWSSEELWACYKCEPMGPTRSLESEPVWVRPGEIL